MEELQKLEELNNLLTSALSEYNKGADNKYKQEERQAIQEENNYDTLESDLPF